MRIVIALGGNALLHHSDRGEASIQQHHVRAAALAIAPLAREHHLVLCYGNGPQVGMLAAESAADTDLAYPFPLDTLGAQTQGMIGYWLAQELANAGVTAPIAVVLTQAVVDPYDATFQVPTELIGPGYSQDLAEQLKAERGWLMGVDELGWRRLVASPEPRSFIEMSTIAKLIEHGVLVICAGGGGVPVIRDAAGLHGVEAVVDKDFAAAMLAIECDADRLVVLTDVEAVSRDFGTPRQSPIEAATVAELRELTFPAGSMGPKVEACIRFVNRTGRPANIGALAGARDVVAGRAGTTILAR
ncbi:carbamate kinase [Jatrophihabitans sp. DSM 45814]